MWKRALALVAFGAGMLLMPRSAGAQEEGGVAGNDGAPGTGGASGGTGGSGTGGAAGIGGQASGGTGGILPRECVTSNACAAPSEGDCWCAVPAPSTPDAGGGAILLALIVARLRRRIR
jgi:hypothetical protein